MSSLRHCVYVCTCVRVCACLCVCVCAPTDRLVFDGGAGHAKVELAVLLDAGIDQSLHGALVLEQQEGVSCTNTVSLLMLLCVQVTARRGHIGIQCKKYLNCSSDRKEGYFFKIRLRDKTEKLKCNNFETNLWGGNRICSLLYEASLQTGAQNAENWLLSHLKYSIWKSA